MTKNQYKNRFSKIISFEGTGAVICFLVGILLVVKFNTLDTWYLQLLGIFAIGYFFLMPFFLMRSLFRIKGLHIAKGNYRDTIKRYANRKKQLMSLQRIAIGLNFFMFLAIVPLSDKILNDNDMFAAGYNNKDAWIFGITILVASAVMILLSRWGYRSYKKVTASAERLLQDLEG